MNIIHIRLTILKTLEILLYRQILPFKKPKMTVSSVDALNSFISSSDLHNPSIASSYPVQDRDTLLAHHWGVSSNAHDYPHICRALLFVNICVDTNRIAIVLGIHILREQ